MTQSDHNYLCCWLPGININLNMRLDSENDKANCPAENSVISDDDGRPVLYLHVAAVILTYYGSN